MSIAKWTLIFCFGRKPAFPERRLKLGVAPTPISTAALRYDRLTSTPVRRCGKHASDFDPDLALRVADSIAPTNCFCCSASLFQPSETTNDLKISSLVANDLFLYCGGVLANYFGKLIKSPSPGWAPGLGKRLFERTLDSRKAVWPCRGDALSRTSRCRSRF
jgi:hypothetical protein